MAVRETLSGVSLILDMGSRDYYGFRDDFLELIPDITPLWTDLSPVDPCFVTAELFCAMGDNLSFYEDRCANENFLYTCTQRASALKFARFATYSVRQNTSAVATITFTVSGAGTISSGFTVGTQAVEGQDQKFYELAADVVCAGAGDYTGDCYEGSSFEEILGSSNGLAGQTFELIQAPVAYNPNGTSSLEIWVKEGANPFEKWTAVNDFNSSSATDKHYQVFVDEQDFSEIKFGDGVNGKIPASGSDNIKAIGRTGGGVEGNQVGENLITEIISSPGIVTAVTNASVPQGGDDKESIDELKVNIPAWIRTNDRYVTEDDYAAGAETVAGVASAKAVRGDSNYQMNVYVRATGANPYPAGTWDSRTETGTGLLGLVGTELNDKREGPVAVEVYGPYLVHVNLDMTVYVHSTFKQETVQDRVERALSACFNGYEIDSLGRAQGVESDIPSTATLPDGFPRAIGHTLEKSYLNHLIESVSGVDYVRITQMQRLPYARKLYDFGANSTFTDMAVTADVLRETWCIRFKSETQYDVTGSTSGLQSTLGTVGSTWTSDNSDLTFKINAGSILNFKENRYEIKTGPYLDSVLTGDFELITNYVVDTPNQYGDDITVPVTGEYPLWNIVYSGGIT